jgi:hypothetical protein
LEEEMLEEEVEEEELQAGEPMLAAGAAAPEDNTFLQRR